MSDSYGRPAGEPVGMIRSRLDGRFLTYGRYVKRTKSLVPRRCRRICPYVQRLKDPTDVCWSDSLEEARKKRQETT
jgi:hypothetical protein